MVHGDEEVVHGVGEEVHGVGEEVHGVGVEVHGVGVEVHGGGEEVHDDGSDDGVSHDDAHDDGGTLQSLLQHHSLFLRIKIGCQITLIFNIGLFVTAKYCQIILMNSAGQLLINVKEIS